MFGITVKNKPKKKLLRGKFYFHRDKNGGHPALVFSTNARKNRYKAVKFTHHYKKDRVPLKHNIDPLDKTRKTYVQKKPIVSKRRDFHSKPIKGLRIHKDDKPLIRKIQRSK